MGGRGWVGHTRAPARGLSRGGAAVGRAVREARARVQPAVTRRETAALGRRRGRLGAEAHEQRLEHIRAHLRAVELVDERVALVAQHLLDGERRRLAHGRLAILERLHQVRKQPLEWEANGARRVLRREHAPEPEQRRLSRAPVLVLPRRADALERLGCGHHQCRQRDRQVYGTLADGILAVAELIDERGPHAAGVGRKVLAHDLDECDQQSQRLLHELWVGVGQRWHDRIDEFGNRLCVDKR